MKFKQLFMRQCTVINPHFKPLAGQDKAVAKLIEAIKTSNKPKTLLGATGTGKTFMVAKTIADLNRQALILAPNKTLAAQLYTELGEILIDRPVEYFVSYYDYYQPEAYIAKRDVYIEKDAAINQEIDRMRHQATNSLLTNNQTVVVASVSAIYGLGSPKEYRESSFLIKKEQLSPDKLLDQLIKMSYVREEKITRASFTVEGDRFTIWPANAQFLIRVEFWGDEVEAIKEVDPKNNQVISSIDSFYLAPATHYNIKEEVIEAAVARINKELDNRLAELLLENKTLESARLEKRVNFDIEMLLEQGFVSGIENYSAIFENRAPGEPPFTLLDYFGDDYLTFVDESHVSLPQIEGMYVGDQARKKALVDFGFRLPSAKDNRPLNFKEFLKRTNQLICVSATPGTFEKDNAPIAAEQINRPTGILDPEIIIKKKKGQINNILKEIQKRIKKDQRTLITTLTKKMAEELSDYLLNKGVKVTYLHSDINTLERIEIIKNLKAGKIDVLVGVNLLREGLDLPEVSLVIILDADQEGFLRNETSLIQTIGRAARNIDGQVILYADTKSPSMTLAIEETNRRRRIQTEYNQKHNITPKTVTKLTPVKKEKLSAQDSEDYIKQLEIDLQAAVEELRFEEAASIRDEINSLTRANPNI